MHCGQSPIHLSKEYLLSISIPATRIQECLWLVTSEPGTTLLVDLLSMDMWEPQTLRLGAGQEWDSSLVPAVFVRSYNATLVNGTTFYFRDTSIWIAFQTSLPYGPGLRSYGVAILLRAENSTDEG